jgi:hypothetical protein
MSGILTSCYPWFLMSITISSAQAWHLTCEFHSEWYALRLPVIMHRDRGGEVRKGAGNGISLPEVVEFII